MASEPGEQETNGVAGRPASTPEQRHDIERAESASPSAELANPDKRSRSLLRPFLLVFLIATALRLVWAWHAHVTPISDSFGYDTTAVHWLETGQYRYLGRELYAYRPPGYSGYLALVYAAFGHSWRAAGLMQAVLGGLTAGLLVILGGRTVSRRVGIISGVLLALWPISIVYVPCLASENLAVFLTVAGLVAMVQSQRGAGWKGVALAALSGLCYGGMFLTRPSLVFMLPAWLVLAAYDPLRRRVRPATLLAWGVAAAAVVSPWLIRSHLLGYGLGTFSTQGGYALWWGNNPKTRDGGSGSPPLLPNHRTMSEIEQHRTYRRLALEWIRQHPRRYLALCRVRLVRMFGKEPDSGATRYFWPTAENDRAVSARYWDRRGRQQPAELVRRAWEYEKQNRKIHLWMRIVTAPVAVVALLLALFRPRRFAFVLLPLLFFALGHALTAFAARYRVVSDPLVLVTVAALLVDVFSRSHDFRTSLLRWAKRLLAVAAVVASVWVHLADVDDGWYRLPPLPEAVAPPVAFGPALGELVEVNLGDSQQVREFSTRSCQTARIDAPSGLRLELAGTQSKAGHQYGGVKIGVPGLAAFRATLGFDSLANIDAVFVDGHAADGTRRVRWTWYPKYGGRLPSIGSPAEYVFVPGHAARELRATQADTSAPIAELRFIVRLKRNTSSALRLEGLIIAVPRASALPTP